MLYLNFLKSVNTGFILALLISSVPSHALAKPPNKNTSSSCLSSKEFNQLAKSSLSDLQLIDPDVTLTDVKTVLKSAGDCATVEQLNYTIEQYSNELTLLASSDTTTDTANTVPVISGVAPQSIVEGGFYLFTPTASDADGDELVFTVQNLPAWANFDNSTGTIIGIPLENDVGLYQDIVINVSDGFATTSLAGINIEVINLASAAQSPLLDEIASYSVYMGTSQDNLSNIVTLDVGTGMDIQANNTLPVVDTYYLSVVAHDRDGNSMVLPNTDIGGYRIYIGTTMSELKPIYNFSEGTSKIYWVNSLSAGTYFVAIATYDINGNQTALSNIAQFDMI